MGQCRFADYNDAQVGYRMLILSKAVGMGGNGYMRVIGEHFAISTPFCCEHEIAPKSPVRNRLTHIYL